jgi:predicted protein tyrosine phosphatase
MNDNRKLPALIVTSAAKASRELLSKSRGPGIKCVVSIGEAGEKRPAGFGMPRARLRLEFADTVDEAEAGIHSTREDIQRLIGFAAVICAADGSTLIHCQAGISRSTAAALDPAGKRRLAPRCSGWCPPHGPIGGWFSSPTTCSRATGPW